MQVMVVKPLEWSRKQLKKRTKRMFVASRQTDNKNYCCWLARPTRKCRSQEEKKQNSSASLTRWNKSNGGMT